MVARKITHHIEGALIEVQYAAADAAQSIAARRAREPRAVGEDLLFTLLAARRLLEDALTDARTERRGS